MRTPWRKALLDLLDRLADDLNAPISLGATRAPANASATSTSARATATRATATRTLATSGQDHDTGELLTEEVRSLVVRVASLAWRSRHDCELAGRLATIERQTRVGSIGARSGSQGASAWRALHVLLHEQRFDWLEPNVAHALGLLGQHELGDANVRSLLAVAEELARSVDGGVHVLAEQLGALHEVLLGVRFERLGGRALRLRANRHWVELRRVLGWPAALRAKRLQREAGLAKRSVERLSDALALANSETAVERALEPLLDARAGARAAGAWVTQRALSQRRAGAHYTPWPLCELLVERTLEPLLAGLPHPRSTSLLELKVCDPAMGVGVFLIAAAEHLSRALVAAWRDEAEGSGAPSELCARARHAVVEHVLRGVDKDALAVGLARLTLAAYVDVRLGALSHLRRTLRVGDALIGAPALVPCAPAAPELAGAVAHVARDPRHGGLDWSDAFPEAFGRSPPGLDAVVGNPPWVAFVGRAAQPLARDLFDYFVATNPAFKRYRTLHGLFVYRCAALLRPRGRLGLVLPTSVADLAGYHDTRAAHDALCEVDAPLPAFGDGAFDGVFQPAMALVSTRRERESEARTAAWRLAGGDLDAVERVLLERLVSLPRLPPHLFGERGYQTTEDDQAHLRRLDAATPTFSVALREGSDVREFCATPPRLFADPKWLVGRLRPQEQWRSVALLIRQTARFPIAAPSDGTAFRNSVLAGFADEAWPAPLLLCYLNSTLVRWFHFTSRRDAREGMPQLKIAHLRALPALPLGAEPQRRELTRLGARLSAQNRGLRADERALLDSLVCDAFELERREREAVLAWAAHNPVPAPRGATRAAAASAEAQRAAASAVTTRRPPPSPAP